MPKQPPEKLETINSEVQLMPTQHEFVFSEAAEILSSGAYGTGKTRALCYRAVRIAQSHPRTRVGLCRLRATDLKRTTLKTMLEPDGDLPPVLPEGSYHHVKTPGEERILLTGGGEIMLFGCEDPVTIGSMSLTDCCIDEAIEFNEEQWNMIMGRCRVTFTWPDGTRNKNTVATATNPGSPKHFLYTKFFKEDVPDRHLITTKSTDNWFLDPRVIKRWLRFRGHSLRRYVYGEWCVSEGAVYPMFDEVVHIRRLSGPWVRYVAGVDYGFRNPMVLRLHALDGRGGSHVITELYRKEVTTAAFSELCRMLPTVYYPIVFVVDPSAPELIASFRRCGLSVVKANNDVLAGIAAVQDALSISETTKEPGLTFEPSCAKGNSEYYGYHWKDNDAKDVVEKKDDHACDADRYAVMHIRLGRGRRRLRSIQLAPVERQLTASTETADGWVMTHYGDG